MRVLLVDDHMLFRSGLSSLVSAWGMDVVGEASNGMQAVEKARALQPDLILMDINIPGISGLDATRLIKEEMADVRVVIVSVSEDPADLFEAIRAGAEGFILKSMSEEQFGQMLSAIAAGEPPLAPGLAAKILREFSRLSRLTAAHASSQDLTDRESDVLQLIATGATNRQIAGELLISENTVNFHLKNIFAKLHVRNRSEAAAQALRGRLVDTQGPDR